MSKVKYEYKKMERGKKTTEKTLLYWINKQGLKGWELFTRGFPTSLSVIIYHFRKKI